MPTALIYEPFQHFIPTGEGWASGLEDLGWNIYRLPETEYRLSEVNEPLDLIIIHDMDLQKSKDICEYKSRYPEVKIAVLISTYDPLFYSIRNHVNFWFNLSVQNTYLSNSYNEKGMPFSCVSLAAHTKYSFPINCSKEYDVSFIGQIGQQGHGYREEDKYLFPVIDRGYRGIFGGFSYNGIQYVNQHYSKLNEIYNKTKVNLNFHYTNQKSESDDPMSRLELNGRTFDIALSGNFQITDNPITKELFGDSIPVVSVNRWVETIDYYLTHEEERQQLSKKARDLALQFHTYVNRAKEILQKIGYDHH
jgi:hypothetical protein